MVPILPTLMTILCLLNQAVAAALEKNYSVSRALLQTQSSSSDTKEEAAGLSTGALVAIIVGSVLGGLVLLLLIVLLARCLCQRRRKVSTNPEKPGPPSETKTRSSGWSWFRKNQPAATRRGAGAPVPPLFGSDKMDPDEISDTSFVLPELGGPNPHNKFDGMEWVDIKGMDDDVLVEISTDLRKYQQRQ